MLNTCCPFTDTQPTCCRRYVQGKCRPSGAEHTHTAHSRHAALHMPPSKEHTHKAHAIRATHRPHTTPPGHITLTVHTLHMPVGPPKSHTPSAQNTRAHIHTRTQPRGSPPALRPSSGPCTLQGQSSLGDTQIGGRLLGARHQVSTAESCPAATSSGPRPGSSPALLSQQPPPEAHSSHPGHPLPS